MQLQSASSYDMIYVFRTIIADLKNHAEKHIADTQQTTPHTHTFFYKILKIIQKFQKYIYIYIKKLKYTRPLQYIYITNERKRKKKRQKQLRIRGHIQHNKNMY